MNKPNKPAHPTAISPQLEFKLPSPPWIAYTFSTKMIRTFTLIFALLKVLHASELTVFTSVADFEADSVSASVWYSDGSWIAKEPERTVIQEGQIIREVYRDLKPGKYRIVLEPLAPIGFSYALKETHVNLKKDASESVILIANDHKNLDLPTELVEAFKMFQHEVTWDLSVRYPGFDGKEKIYQVRTVSAPEDLKQFIHYLRPDGEYTVSIWDEEAGKGYAYEKSFRVGQKQQSEQGSTAQPATRSQSKSEGGDKPKPEAEGGSR